MLRESTAVLVNGTYLDFSQGDYRKVADREGNTFLHLICAAGEDALVESALRFATLSDLEMKNTHGWTPLHFACFEGKELVAERLLRKGANSKAEVILGPIPKGSTPAAEKIIKDRRTGAKYAPLHLLVDQGLHGMVPLLADLGADLNQKDEEGYSPLHIACRKGHVLAVEALLKAGADVNAKSSRKYTPAHSAAQGANVACLKVLDRYRADFHALSDDGQSTLLMARGIYFSKTRYKENNLTMEFLLNKGINPNHIADDGLALIHHFCDPAVNGSNKFELYEQLSFILKHPGPIKVDVNLRNRVKTKEGGRKPIAMAAQNGGVDYTNLLVAYGATIGPDDLRVAKEVYRTYKSGFVSFRNSDAPKILAIFKQRCDPQPQSCVLS